MARTSVPKTSTPEPEADDEVGILELDQSLEEVERPPELPNGDYNAEVQSVEVKTSGKGNDYFSVSLRIDPDSIPPDYREHFEDGATMSYNRVIVPKSGDRRALYNLKKLIESLGLPTNTTRIDPSEWMGREVRVTLKQSKYENEMRAGISALKPIAAPSRARAQAAEADAEPEAPRTRGRR